MKPLVTQDLHLVSTRFLLHEFKEFNVWTTEDELL